MATDASRGDPEDLESPLTITKIHVALGVVLARAGRFDEARRELGGARDRIDELLRRRPQDSEAAYVSQLTRQNTVALGSCADGRPCNGTGRLRLPTLLS